MANVIYDSKNINTTFSDLKEGDYFDFDGQLFLFVDDSREGLVFDFEEGYSFYWCDDYDLDTPVKIIASNRVTIKVD